MLRAGSRPGRDSGEMNVLVIIIMYSKVVRVLVAVDVENVMDVKEANPFHGSTLPQK